MKTYFVVQPYERCEDGFLWPMEALQAKNTEQAKRLAHNLNCAGAVAFSRACDPDLGEYEDAVILLKVGQVPEDGEELAA